MNKDFSVGVKVGLNAAGFTTGAQKFSKDAKNLQNSIVGGNNAIKSSFASLTSQALPQLGQQFGALNGVFGGIKSAMSALIPAFGSVKTAFIATGIGAIILGISVAIAGLIGWMKRTDEGSDTMRKVFDIIKAVINTVLEKITFLGSAIVKLFKGDFKGAAEDAKAAFTGWNDSIKDGIENAKKLNETQDKLEDFNETYALRKAKIEERISELQAKARDEENFSSVERLDFTKQLEQANKALFELNYNQKALELKQLREEMSISADNQDNRQKVNEKEAELIGMRTQYNQSLKETIKLTNKLSEQAEAQVQREKQQADWKANPMQTMQSKDGGVSGAALPQPDFSKLPKSSPALSTGVQMLDIMHERMKVMAEEMPSLAESLTNAMETSFGKLADVLGQGADNFKKFGQQLKQAVKGIIGTLISQAVATMVASALKDWSTKVPFGYIIAPVMAAAAGGLAKTAFNSLVGSFATGGIVPNTGYALVGERGPEIVKLPANTQVYSNQQSRSMLGGLGGFGGSAVTFRIEGDTLVGVLNNYNKGKNSI
jgi:hypothetical protein